MLRNVEHPLMKLSSQVFGIYNPNDLSIISEYHSKQGPKTLFMAR